MLKIPRIISLNIGSHTIGLAEFRSDPQRGLILLNYRLRELGMDSRSEKTWRAQISTTLRQMIPDLGIRHEAVNYAVPAESVFSRFVKLPALEDEKFERIVAFEAQQNVPFPIDEVVWDYQLIGGGSHEQIEVVLVAIKADVLEEINSAVEETGLRTTIVDLSAMTLYNAFRYNYHDLSGCSLLVDIGARTTDLLFMEPQKMFSRTIPIGGASIRIAVSNEVGEPFAAPDLQRKRQDLVGLGGGYGEPAESEVALIAKSKRKTMSRLHAEVTRSISHYRAHQQGRAPNRLFLCGGVASTPYMREFFGQKLQLPIEYFNPLRHVEVAPSVPVEDISRSAPLFGELVGLALRSIGNCSMSLNLRPEVVIHRQELERRRPAFVMAAAAALLALLGWDFYYARAAQVTRTAAQRITASNAPMRAAEAKIDKLRQEIAKLDAVSSPLIVAISDRSFWAQILNDLNSRLPKEDIWITELIPISAGKPVGIDQKRVVENLPTSPPSKSLPNGSAIDALLLRGLYLYNAKQQEVVVEYFKNLVGSPFFNVDPNNQALALKASIPNNNEWAFPYELRLGLKKSVKIQ